MTVLYPKRFKEAQAADFDGLFHWDFLLPAFVGTKITPTDIDAVIERNGSCLFFETKQKNADIKLGQTITFNTLLHQGRGLNFLIFLQAKRPEEIVGWELWNLGKHEIIKKVYHEGDANDLLQWVDRWFRWASCLKPMVPA